MTLQYSVVPESSASFLLLGLAAVFSQLRRRA
jgi:hypothetical protein